MRSLSRPGRHIPAALALALLASGCPRGSSDKFIDQPQYTVALELFALHQPPPEPTAPERREGDDSAPVDDTKCGLVDERSCWKFVQGEENAEELSADQPECGLDEADYVVQPGRSRFFVGARFADGDTLLEFDAYPMLEGQPLIDGVPIGGATELETREGDFHNLAAVGSVPAVTGGRFRIELGGDGEPFKLTEATDLAAPDFEVQLNGSDDDFPGGVGTATLCIEVPAGFGDSATFVSEVLGVPATSGTVSLATVVAGRRFGTAAVPIPPTARGDWTVSAFAGGLAGTATASLREPRALDLQATRADSPADSQPAESVTPGDSNPTCRSYAVTLASEDIPLGASARLTTNAGGFAGGTAELVLPVIATPELQATLLLPRQFDADPIIVTASVDGFTTAVRSIEVTPLGALSGRLFPVLGGAIPVGAEGSLARSLSGKLEPPAGSEFPPGFELMVRIDPMPAPDSEIAMLQCAEPLEVQDFECNPSTGDGPGCELLPPTVAVTTDGSFSLSVPGGICFAGEVVVEVSAPAYEDGSEGCLADNPVQQRALADATIEFEAVPAAP